MRRCAMSITASFNAECLCWKCSEEGDRRLEKIAQVCVCVGGGGVTLMSSTQTRSKKHHYYLQINYQYQFFVFPSKGSVCSVTCKKTSVKSHQIKHVNHLAKILFWYYMYVKESFCSPPSLLIWHIAVYIDVH